MKATQLISRQMKKFGLGITQNQKYDIQTNRIMKTVLRPDSNCLDVGCFEGEMLEQMIKFCPRGQHHAFEPIPPKFNALDRKFNHIPNVTVHHCALAAEDGEAEFNYVISNPAYSGLVKRSYDRPNEKDETIRVPTYRLDTLVGPDYTVDFLKIDVEGGEMGVFNGGQNLIRRSKPIVVFESGIGGTNHYGTTPEMIFDFLTSCGLELNTMKGWLAGEAPFSEADFLNQFNNHLNYYFIAHPKGRNRASYM